MFGAISVDLCVGNFGADSFLNVLLKITLYLRHCVSYYALLHTHLILQGHYLFVSIAVIYVTKSRTGNYDFRACARALGFPGSTLFGRTHMLRRVCRAITR